MLQRFLKSYQALLFAAVAVMLVLLSVAGFFNRPTVDDLAQPLEVAHALENGGGLPGALKAAWDKMAYSYVDTCGTFLAMFLSYIPPMNLDYRLAWIHPIFLLLLIAGACLAAAYCLRAANPAMPRRVCHCAALLMIALLLNLMPSISEGIYWYSGAINYTFSFFLGVLLFSSLLAIQLRSDRGQRPGWPGLALLSLGFFLLGGGSFNGAAVFMTLCAYYALYLLLRKKPKRLLIPCLFMALGFLTSVLAPGNRHRQEIFGSHYPLTTTFLRSFFQSFQMAFEDARLWLFLLLFVPVILAALPRLPLKFRHPLLIPALGWTLMAASMVPSYYAFASIGPARQINTHFFTICFVLAVCLAYEIGWARRLVLERYAPKAAPPAKVSRFAPWVYTALVLALFFGTALRELEFRPAIVFNCYLPPVKAFTSLRDGSLKAFADTYDDMVAAVAAQPDGDVTVTSQPAHYLFGEIVVTSDPEDWYNWSFCQRYGGRSIVYQPDDPAAEIHR